MNVRVFSTKPYDERFLSEAAAEGPHELMFLEPRLTAATVGLADGAEAVCVFVNDVLDAEVVRGLAERGVRAIALRCAGFNNVDLNAAKEAGLRIVRVPAYSPHAVAEHAMGLVLALNRHLHRAYQRVRDGDFRLNGLLGFDLRGRTVGVVGTGEIGAVFAQIVSGFGCEVIAHDPRTNPAVEALGGRYVSLDELLAEADIVSLHCPLNDATHHLIDAAAIDRMKHGVMLINTSRGAVVDTRAVIAGLKTGKIGHLGIDVYEEESEVFFEDRSAEVIPDDVLARLLTFPNVMVTGHQAFFTEDAMRAIARTTIANLDEVARGDALTNGVSA